jgi:hypothetical protein
MLLRLINNDQWFWSQPVCLFVPFPLTTGCAEEPHPDPAHGEAGRGVAAASEAGAGPTQ